MTVEEASLYSIALIGPGVLLVAAAWTLPTWLGRRLPESMLALGVNLAVSAFLLWALSALAFAGSYALQGVPARALVAGASHFAGLGRLAGLLWGPVLLLALAVQPQHWRPEL
ncbi:MAG: hypothetical protein AAFP13_11875 [Pseudomonadota bacterium]